MPDWVMINLGIDPVTSAPDEWQEAAAWLQDAAGARATVRAYYGNDYLPDLQEGTSAAMAWSGDILYSTSSGFPEFATCEFVVPRGRGADLDRQHAASPAGAQNPVGAPRSWTSYYDPEYAAMLTEWILVHVARFPRRRS